MAWWQKSFSEGRGIPVCQLIFKVVCEETHIITSSKEEQMKCDILKTE